MVFKATGPYKLRDECDMHDLIAKSVNPDFLYQTLLKSLAREKR